MSYIKNILSKVKENKISNLQGVTLLIEFFHKTANNQERFRCLQGLHEIIPITQKSFDFLENLLISDETAAIRTEAARIIITHFSDKAINALKWIIENENSPLVLEIVFKFILMGDKTNFQELQSEIRDWYNQFGRKLDIVPEESKFIFDIEALFAKVSNSSNILSEDTLTFYEFLREVNSPDRWLCVENGHIIKLKFNFIKWRYLKEYSGQRSELKKYRDLDMLLSVLLNKKSIESTSLDIPSSLSLLTYLKELDLSQNNLTDLPESLKALKSLKYLDLSHNRLKSIPKFLFFLEDLRYLDLSHNKIRMKPISFQSLGNVKEIKIEGNYIY